MDISFNLSWPVIIGLLISIVLPLGVGLITKTVTHPGVKAVILAAVTAVTGILTELLAALNAGTTFDLGNALLLWVGSFLVAVGMHFGIWKPTTLSTKAQMAFSSNNDDGTAV